MKLEDCQLWVLQGHGAGKYSLPSAVSVRICFKSRDPDHNVNFASFQEKSILQSLCDSAGITICDYWG